MGRSGSMAPRLISVVGSLHVDRIMITDRIPDRGESYKARQYHETLGGKGANSAIAVYRSSHARPSEGKLTSSDERIDYSNGKEIEVCMIGAVGDDKYAQMFEDALQENGVDVSRLQKVDGPTGISFVLVESANGENRCIFASNANDALSVDYFANLDSLANGRPPDLVIAQMEIDRTVVEQMIETAGAAGIEFLLNAAPANYILSHYYPLITHLLVNETEAATMSGREVEEVNEETWQEITEYFLGKGVTNVVLTLGARGAFFGRADEFGHVPAFKVDVNLRDTFTGAYATDYLRQKQMGQWDIREAVVRACKAAALTITHLGAQEGIPWMDEIDNFEEHELSRAGLEAASQSATSASEEL
ncbi:ribokinase [Fonsecaea monophora]|uniref:Ribokinase n=1 Tax=Fonsecaea monophora TaxID=254056 RepID=A0A177EWE1_9EURO|nr:ribokinase [Fonsecaea monophora]KAH0835214.1 ribokinase [Fonsecaea pedrosoi]OAG36355.1 ribokinase [Fonsecaea monophora]